MGEIDSKNPNRDGLGLEVVRSLDILEPALEIAGLIGLKI